MDSEKNSNFFTTLVVDFNRISKDKCSNDCSEELVCTQVKGNVVYLLYVVKNATRI